MKASLSVHQRAGGGGSEAEHVTSLHVYMRVCVPSPVCASWNQILPRPMLSRR